MPRDQGQMAVSSGFISVALGSGFVAVSAFLRSPINCRQWSNRAELCLSDICSLKTFSSISF